MNATPATDPRDASPGATRPRRALLSVSDKAGLVDFARGLGALGFEIVSTGGTRRELLAAGVPVTAVAEVTGFPEILDGRVKTLHPAIHGGILGDRDRPEHRDAMRRHGIDGIDLVAVNLYPFQATVARPDCSFAEAIETIDIGGPAMVRAAAKNHAHVWVLVDPADYGPVLAALAAGGDDPALRRRLALAAYRHTAAYDAAVAGWFAAQVGSPGGSETPAGAAAAFPARFDLHLERREVLRYGENPHQAGAVYATLGETGSGGGGAGGASGLLGGYRQTQGKELSWNNLLDADAARKLVALFEEPAVVIVKHNNPCGVGRGEDLATAFRRALSTDPVSAFGSILALNRPADLAFVEAMGDLFVEVLVAPGYAGDAAGRLAGRKNLRALVAPPYAPRRQALELRPIDGGFLAQPPDGFEEPETAWTCPTRRQPTAAERSALSFAWRVARYVKSNAIVITNEHQTVGVGAGQMSRVDSCRLAVGKAQFPVAGTVAASDAFFPFRDGLDVLADAGVTAIVHPGGSKRDDEVVAAADERGLALLLTGVRHFRH